MSRYQFMEVTNLSQYYLCLFVLLLIFQHSSITCGREILFKSSLIFISWSVYYVSIKDAHRNTVCQVWGFYLPYPLKNKRSSHISLVIAVAPRKETAHLNPQKRKSWHPSLALPDRPGSGGASRRAHPELPLSYRACFSCRSTSIRLICIALKRCCHILKSLAMFVLMLRYVALERLFALLDLVRSWCGVLLCW